MHKTLKQWTAVGGGLADFLTVGDTVGKYLVDFILTVSPPATLQANLLQMGGPIDTDPEGHFRYLTIYRELNRWICAGVLVSPPASDYKLESKNSNLEE